MTSSADTSHQTTLSFETPTTIAILGAGRVGSALAIKLASRGHHIVIGKPNHQGAQAAWTGATVRFDDPASAAQAAEIVINATPGDTSLERLSAMQAALDGKVLLDLANATRRSEHSPIGELMYPGSSLAEQLQSALPGSRVVKALNTMMFKVMTDPQSLSTPPTAFISGNDAAAKATVVALLAQLGWTPQQTLDLGDITTARGTEALFMFVPYLVRSLGFVPFALSVAH